MDHSQHHLSTSDDRYRVLIEAIVDYAIYMLDPSGIVTSWNPGAERFKGYTAQEIIGKHFSQFYSQEDRASGLPARALETAAREGKFESEGWRYRKDGSRFWAYVVIDPIRLPDGSIGGYAKITRDLTERRAAEEALRQSQEQFRLLVQGVTDYAIYLLDEDGIVTNWNLGAERIKGYQPDEIIGRSFAVFYTPEERDAGLPQKTLEIVRRVGRTEREGWRVRKDGTRFWAHVIIDAIRDESGKLIGFAKITRDVTEKKRAEEELELARRALLQSQKMEAIGQLTGGVAHDFNNLLMAIIGSLELINKRAPDDPKLKMLLNNAMQGAQRGATLTKRMLAFARRQNLRLAPVDIPMLVRNMGGLLQQTLGNFIAIETRFPLVCKPVVADDNELEMALLNLVVNARDAMPNGGTIVISARMEQIEARTHDGLRPGEYLCLSVVDTGTGMDAETLRRATEPFFTTKGTGKGTGLGLATIHGLAEQAGGLLRLSSTLGEGTTAELWLPIAQHVTEPQNVAKISTPSKTDLRQPRLVILAVDDDPLVLINTVAMLEDLGHTVVAAASGEEALNLFAANDDIQLVITDQVMPGMTGLDLITSLRRQHPDLPVVLASAFAEIDDDQFSNLPTIAKPFTQRELAEAIADFARQNGSNVHSLAEHRADTV